MAENRKNQADSLGKHGEGMQNGIANYKQHLQFEEAIDGITREGGSTRPRNKEKKGSCGM